MGMSVGGGGAQKADINVTPLIDVLLVLLIIFMVIAFATATGLDATSLSRRQRTLRRPIRARIARW